MTTFVAPRYRRRGAARRIYFRRLSRRESDDDCRWLVQDIGHLSGTICCDCRRSSRPAGTGHRRAVLACRSMFPEVLDAVTGRRHGRRAHDLVLPPTNDARATRLRGAARAGHWWSGWPRSMARSRPWAASGRRGSFSVDMAAMPDGHSCYCRSIFGGLVGPLLLAFRSADWFGEGEADPGGDPSVSWPGAMRRLRSRRSAGSRWFSRVEEGARRIRLSPPSALRSF